MKRYTIHLLATLDLLLALALSWLWFDASGQLRNVHWAPPAPQKPDFSGALPPATPANAADVSRFLATLERPLFSPSRRPPPPVVVVAPPPPPPPDPLNTIQLFGLFAGKDSAGVLAKVDGKMRRIHLTETVGDWSLKAIQDRDITFVRGAETRVLPLVHARPPPPPAPPVMAANPAGGASPPGTGPASGGAPAANTAINQQMQDFVRERLRARNEILRRAGLPPVTQ